MASRHRVRQRLHGFSRAHQDLTGMNDLPDEILLEAAKDMDDESLFRLSMTSRRFNSFALPILFQRHKLVPGFFYLVLNRLPTFILTAFRTAFFLHGCSWLYIGGLSSEPRRLKQEIHNILLLVKQWPELSSLTLHFDNHWGCSPIDISNWKQPLIALLDITATQCSALNVTGRGDYYDSGDNGTNMKLQRPSATNRSSIKATPATSHVSKLSSFAMNSSLFFIPQFFPKTLSILSNSSTTISYLSLDCVISAEMVSKLLQDLTVPSLSTFAFRPKLSGVLSLEHFAAFLCRHQSIKILEIQYPFTDGKNLISTPSFPNLIRLDAYPKSMPWFLASAHNLPVLTDIGILFEDLSDALSWEVSVAISRLRRDIHVSFIILHHLPFQDWARSCVAASISRERVISSLLNVTNLTLKVVSMSSADFKTTIVPWLALFPSLRAVNIVGEILGVDWKNPESDFFKLVASTCPGLEAIGCHSRYFYLDTLHS